MLYDTQRVREARLPDGTLLSYRRPGGNMMRTVRERSRLHALDEGAAFFQEVDGSPERQRVMDAARDGESAAEKTRAEEAELRRRKALPREERKALEREELFDVIHHPLLIASAGVKWADEDGTALVDLAADDRDAVLTALRDLPEDTLEEAARVIFDAHFDRAREHRGN